MAALCAGLSRGHIWPLCCLRAALLLLRVWCQAVVSCDTGAGRVLGTVLLCCACVGMSCGTVPRLAVVI
jgi:hypothetical protein